MSSRFSLALCDKTLTPLRSVARYLIDVISYDVPVEQCDVFDGGTVTVSDAYREDLQTIAANTTVLLIDNALGGPGNVKWAGVIDNPSQDIRETGAGTIVLNCKDVTDQTRDTNTGRAWIASNSYAVIAARLGSLTTVGESILTGYDAQNNPITTVVPGAATGWSASYVDNGVYSASAAPVQWTATATATAIGNTITKNGNAPGGWTAGGVATPQIANNARDGSVSWQVVPTTTDVICGLSAAANPIPAGIDFGIYAASDGTWKILENGVAPAGGTGTKNGTYTANTQFSVNYVAASNAVVYYVNGLRQFQTTKAATFPLMPVCSLTQPNSQITNCVITRIVQDGQRWWSVRYDGATQLAAVQQFAKNINAHARRGVDANGNPARTFEIGQFQATSNLRLVSANMGDPQALMKNTRIRLIRTLKQTTDYSGIVTVATPLGGGTGMTQVSIEKCWRLLNDTRYAGYQAWPNPRFPEYDPNFTIHRVATGDGYEYYIRCESSFATYGEKRGGVPDSQFVYADQTIGNQELTQRALYLAFVAKLKRAAQPHVVLEIETAVIAGQARPSRAGDMVRVDWQRSGVDAGGPFAKERINADYMVMKVRERASGDTVTQVWTLTDAATARLPFDQGSIARESARQLDAVQRAQVAVPSLSILPSVFREFDAGTSTIDHSILYKLTIPATVYRVTGLHLRVDFLPFRQTATVAAGGDHTHFFTIPDHDHPPVAGLATDTGQIGGIPGHAHAIQVRGGSVPGVVPAATDRWIYAFDDGLLTRLYANNGKQMNDLITSGGISNVNLAPTAHPHTFSNTTKITKTFSFAQQTTASGPHTHDLTAGVIDGLLPARVQVLIDAGDGNFVDRSAQLLDTQSNAVGPFTAAFEFTDASQYVNLPGKTITIKFRSIGTPSNPLGLGALAISGALTAEIGGLAAIVQAAA